VKHTLAAGLKGMALLSQMRARADDVDDDDEGEWGR